MTEDDQNKIFDIAYEMRGLSATLLAASRGDLQAPEKVIEYTSCQLTRLSDELASAISSNPEKPAS